MEVVLLMLLGLFWLLVYAGKGVFGLCELSSNGRYNSVAKDIVATDEEVFETVRMLQSPQNRGYGFAEIQDVLDDIFGDEWYYWTELRSAAWDKLTEGYAGNPYKYFKNVCFHLLLASKGKVYKYFGGKLSCGGCFYYFSEEESLVIRKKIHLAIEKMLKEKHPEHAHDVEMVMMRTHSKYGGSEITIATRFEANHDIIPSSGWERLEL